MARIPNTEQITRMIDARAAERVDLEFKAEPWAPNDAGKKECLKDISALANTVGGQLFIGIGEENNAAKELKPMAAAVAEAERSRIESLLHSGLEPRLYGVTIESVAVGGGVVIAIDVPRSASRPHRVTTAGSNRFWLRNSTGAYEANVTDLRNLFGQSAEFGERAASWHAQRRAALRTGDIVPNLATDARALILHLIPADAFAIASPVDLAHVQSMGMEFWPMGSTGYNNRFAYEGALFYSAGDPCRQYTLVQRNGIVEGVKIGVVNADSTDLYATYFENQLVKHAKKYGAALVSLGVAPPIYAIATIEGTRGASLPREFGVRGAEVTRSELTLPLAMIEAFDTDAEVGAAFRATFDTLWNAAGAAASPNFDAAGKWTGRTE